MCQKSWLRQQSLCPWKNGRFPRKMCVAWEQMWELPGRGEALGSSPISVWWPPWLVSSLSWPVWRHQSFCSLITSLHMASWPLSPLSNEDPFKWRPFCFTVLILISTFLLHFKFLGEDFPGGPVVKNPPDNAGFMGLISGLKYPHVPGQVSLCTMTTEARALETGLCNKRSPHNKKPKHRK